MGVSDLLTRSNTPSFCIRCGAPVIPSSRFCEQCGKPVEPVPEKRNQGEHYRLPRGPRMDSRCRPDPLEVLAEELRVYRRPDYFAGEVEDLQNRLDEACVKVMGSGGDWNRIVAGEKYGLSCSFLP